MPHETPKERREDERMRKRKSTGRGHLDQSEDSGNNKPFRTNPPGQY